MMVGRDVLQFAVEKKPCERVRIRFWKWKTFVVPSGYTKGTTPCAGVSLSRGRGRLRRRYRRPAKVNVYGITGLEKPTSGTIKLEGKDITSAPIRSATRRV